MVSNSNELLRNIGISGYRKLFTYLLMGISRYNIFNGSCQNVSIMRKPGGERRSIIKRIPEKQEERLWFCNTIRLARYHWNENIPRFPFGLFQTCMEHVNFLPMIENTLFFLRKIYIFRNPVHLDRHDENLHKIFDVWRSMLSSASTST